MDKQELIEFLRDHLVIDARVDAGYFREGEQTLEIKLQLRGHISDATFTETLHQVSVDLPAKD